MDDEDFEWLNQWKWCALWLPKKKDYYAVRVVWNPKGSQPKSSMVRMHRLILSAPTEFQVDHINNMGLDNQRTNLRLATHTQNMRNRTVTKISKSGLKGVYYRASRPNFPFQVTIKADGITYQLGSYKTKEEARDAHNAGAIKYHKEFAHVEQ